MEIIHNIVVVLVPMILSLTVHEYAHAWSAYKLGDNTAASQGRLTLNPLPHIDPIGTLLIPIFSALNPAGLALIGWAKPVPVSPNRFNRSVSMRTGMIITAVAGPASNLLFAFLAAGIITFFGPSLMDVAQSGAVVTEHPLMLLLKRFFVINVFLAIFNMLPVYPLDGSRLLPLHIQAKMARYTMLVFLGFILLINFAGGILWIPASIVIELLMGFWSIFV